MCLNGKVCVWRKLCLSTLGGRKIHGSVEPFLDHKTPGISRESILHGFKECYQVCMSKGLLVIQGVFLGVPTLQREIVFRLLLNISGEIDDIEGALSVRSGKMMPKV